MNVKHVEDLGDSLLVVQQIADNFQCFNGLLDSYLDRCLEIIAAFDILLLNMLLDVITT